MLDVIKNFFSGAKLYIYLAIFVSAIAFWSIDRHAQFVAGQAFCAQQYKDAETQNEQRREAQQEQEKQTAVKEANDAANHINSLENKKTKEVAKTNELSKASPSSILCDLSSQQLLDFNQAINRNAGSASTNNLPSGKPRKLSKPVSTKGRQG